MDSHQEFPHHGADGLDLLETAVRDEVAVVAPDMGVVACGAQGGHVEGDAQVAVAGLGQAWFFVHAGAGVVDLRIETSQSDPLLGLHVRGQDQEFAEELDGAGGGDAGDAGEEVEGLLKVRIGGNQVQDPLAEVFDLGVEVFDVVPEIGQEKIRCQGGLLCRMKLILGLCALFVQGGDATRAGTDAQGQVVGALPRLERHALGELCQKRGIDGIGLGPRLHRFGKALGGLGIDDHDGQPGIIQGEGQIEVIQPRGLEADTLDLGFVQDLAQGGMTLGGIGELPGFSRAPLTADDQSDSFGADIDSGGIHGVVPLKSKSD